MAYTAENIKILSDKEVCDSFTWLRAHELANEYKRPVAFIERHIEACRLAGVDLDWFISKYLKGNDEPRNEEVEAISRELQLKGR